MEKQAKVRISSQLDYLISSNDKLIIDSDTHISNSNLLSQSMAKKVKQDFLYFHGKPADMDELVFSMDLSKIDMSLSCLSWQNPSVTQYFVEDEQRNFESLFAANKYIYDSSIKYMERIIPAGWTDPAALGKNLAIEMVDICVDHFGFGIIKINPAQNRFMINSEQVVEIVTHIIKKKAVPAFQFGADTKYTSVSELRFLAEKFENSKLLAIHMGGGGACYIEAEDLYQNSLLHGKNHSNIMFVESAKHDTHIRNDLLYFSNKGTSIIENLAWASDFPYGLQVWNFGGLKSLIHELEASLLRNELNTNRIMGGNMKNLLMETYQNLLS